MHHCTIFIVNVQALSTFPSCHVLQHLMQLLAVVIYLVAAVKAWCIDMYNSGIVCILSNTAVIAHCTTNALWMTYLYYNAPVELKCTTDASHLLQCASSYLLHYLHCDWWTTCLEYVLQKNTTNNVVLDKLSKYIYQINFNLTPTCL